MTGVEKLRDICQCAFRQGGAKGKMVSLGGT